MSAISNNNFQSICCRPCVFIYDNKILVITFLALASTACLLTGLLSQLKVISGVNTIASWSLVGVGGLAFFTATGLYFKKDGVVRQDPTWTGQEAKDASNDQSKKLVITTFNVGMLPSFVTRLQNVGHCVKGLFSPSKDKRLDPAVKRIKIIAQILKSDIITFQEVFCPLATASLCKDLKGYHIIHSVGGGKLINSGLIFASRHPINKEGIRFHKFTNLGGEDDFASKGVLRVSVMIKGKEIIFYNTHLQAKFGPRYQKIRQEQITSVADLIDKDQKENPDTPIFLCGDFNMSDIDVHGRTNDCSKLRHIFRKFHDYFVHDYFFNTHRGNKATGSFYDMHIGHEGEVCKWVLYDRILLHKTKRSNHLTSAVSHSEFQSWAYDGSRDPAYLSDHLPLTVTLN